MPPSTILLVAAFTQNASVLREQARSFGKLVGLDGLQQTRFSTAVSEIARNAVQYAGGGTCTFSIGPSPKGPRRLCAIAEIKDSGPGIFEVDKALQGFRLPTGRETMGIPGSLRLMDRMVIESSPQNGTLVRMEMDRPNLAPYLDASQLAEFGAQLGKPRAHSALEEVEQQNRELLKIHEQLRQKQMELEKADQRKNQFVTTLAHELRNPLSTLDLSIAVLRLKPQIDSPELLKRCDVMSRQTAQLTRLVDDMMDVARVSQGKVQLRRDRMDLTSLVKGAVEMTTAATQAKGHHVEIRASADPAWIVGDGPRLIQVLSNLLQNAARYTPPGGSIVVEVGQSDGRAVVDVTDNGIGIGPDLMPHVFDLFVQGEGNPTGAGGLGIGLALVRHLVMDHGGTVAVASEGVDRGSRFTVCLPLAEDMIFTTTGEPAAVNWPADNLFGATKH